MKKKILIIVITIFSFFVFFLIGSFVFYKNSLGSTGKESEVVEFVVPQGSTSKNIIDSLYKEGLIKNKYTGYIFIKTHKNYVLQAGNYSLNKGMDIKDILDHIASGKVIDDSISVTFIEGKRLTNYVKVISEKFGYSEEEILKQLSDKEYLQTLIDKYWFLTNDILNDKLYYALEGYLYPDTYQFKKDATVPEIVDKMLSETKGVLDEHKDEFTNSKYSVHQILTMASIVELEGMNSSDRKGVAGVFYNRLNSGMSLGSDVTTYYGVRVEMSERDLWQKEIDQVNDYNTRVPAMAGKLPIGPICSPSKESIIGALEPSNHDYLYFVADKNGKTYFSKNYNEHLQIINKLKKEGLWYTYK